MTGSLTKKIPLLQENHHFPIFGIGASTGGLEVLEQFMLQIPPRYDMALVIIQHLDPTHKGIMAELQQRVTPLEVFQVKDRMRLLQCCDEGIRLLDFARTAKVEG